MGAFDLDQEEKQSAITTGRAQYCECCMMIVHEEKINCCQTALNDIEGIGVTTLIFFEFTKQMAFLLLSNFVLYGVYALVTDIYEQNFSSTDAGCLKAGSCPFVKLIGISSKLTPIDGRASPLLVAQAWLGLAVTVVWIAQLVLVHRRYRQVSDQIDDRLTTASDFTAQLYNLPRNINYTEQDVID